MHIMTVSKVSVSDSFWNSLKSGYGQLPAKTMWVLAVASTDGSKAVNIFVHDSIDGVREFFEKYTDAFAVTEYFEVDADNAVGLGKK